MGERKQMNPCNMYYCKKCGYEIYANNKPEDRLCSDCREKLLPKPSED